MKNKYTSSVSGLELVRKYAYLEEFQWAEIEKLRLPLGISVSQYISNLVIAAIKAKEHNVSITRK